MVRPEKEPIAANVRLEDDLSNSLACIGVEVGQLNGGGLLEQCVLLGAGGDEGCTLVSVLGSDVPADGTALIEDEAIVILCQKIFNEHRECGTEYARCKGPGRTAASPRTGEPCARLS